MNIKKESCVRLVNKIIKNPNDYALFLGAGCSISSGLPDGKSIIDIIKKIVFTENIHASESIFRKKDETLISFLSRVNEFISYRESDFNDFIKTTEEEFNANDFTSDVIETNSFYKTNISKEDYVLDSLYGLWFEKYSINVKERQKLIEEIIEWSTSPSGGYVLLAFLLSKGYFNNIFTTNFDSLIEDTLSFYFNIKPRVFHHNELSKYINLSSNRPNIVKLHGDYLFENIKNLPYEVSFLENDLEIKLLEAINKQGIIFIGFNGADDSIMKTLYKLLNKKDVTIYWCGRGDVEYINWKARKVLSDGLNAYYVKIDGFDDLMLEIYDSSRLKIKYDILDNVKKRDFKMKQFMKNFHNKRHKRSHKIYDEISLTTDFNLIPLEELRNSIETKIESSNFEELNDYAIILVKNKEYVEAELIYKKSIELQANFVNWYNLGVLFDDLQQYDNAIECYNESLNLNPNFHFPLNNIAVIYNSLKNYNLAIDYVEESLKIKADNTNLINKSIFLKNIGEIDIAIDMLSEIEKNSPNDSRLLCNKSNFYRIKGDIESAEESALKAYKLDKDNDYVVANLAQVYALKEDVDNFYFYLKEALELNYPIWRKKNISDKAFENIKKEKKFKDLLNKYKPAIYE